MRILAIETATWTCSVALVRDGVVLAERGERTESSHARTLPRVVGEVMDDAGERLERGDAVAVSIGPGSFTGLRIGLSFAKGLGFSRGLRLLGVPTLDALALAAPAWDGRLCAALDARKREVYAAVYERSGDRIVRRGEACAITAEGLAAALDAMAARDGVPAPAVHLIGDAVEAYGDALRAAIPGLVPFSSAEHPPRASAVARLAAGRLTREPSGDDLASLAPAYLRPPEAELKQGLATPSQALSAAHFVDKVDLVY